MNIGLEQVYGVLDIVAIIRNYLIPFAIIFFLLNVIHGIWTFFFSEKDRQNDEENSGIEIVGSGIKRSMIQFGLYMAFPILALAPLWFINSINETFEEFDPVNTLFESKMTLYENWLETNSYLTPNNKDAWNEASLQNKLSIIRKFKAVEEAKTKASKNASLKSSSQDPFSLSEKEQDDNIDKMNEELNDVATSDNFSMWDMLTDLDILDLLNYVFIIIINYIRDGIEYLISKLFTFLLYLDYFIGIFVALVGILPWYRSNLINWVGENLSLLLWVVIFKMIDWILGLVSLTVISEGTGLDSWIMPLLSIIIYGTVGYQAGRIIGGREAGGGTLRQISSVALNAIPTVGVVMTGMLKQGGAVASSSPFGQAMGGVVRGAVGSKVAGAFDSAAGAVKNSVDYFKPRTVPSTGERTASGIEELVKKF